jgi:hypothetical protein
MKKGEEMGKEQGIYGIDPRKVKTDGKNNPREREIC